MNLNFMLLGIRVKNAALFRQLQQEGWDYVLNPETGELHRVRGGQLAGSHNLATASLDEFIWIVNIGSIPIDWCLDGSAIPLYDIQTGEQISFTLNKCKYCFPSLF